MAKARKDNKGRALRKGESQRTEDMRYVYTYTDPYGKRRYIYANDLRTLREKEDKLLKDQLDGLYTRRWRKTISSKAEIGFTLIMPRKKKCRYN